MAESWSNRTQTVNGLFVMNDYLHTKSPVTTYSYPPAMSVGSSRTCNNTPGYHTLAKLGKDLPINEFYYSKTERMYPKGHEQWFTDVYDGPTYKGLYPSALYVGTFSSYTWEGLVSSSNIYPQGIADRCARRAVNNLLSNMKDQKGDMMTAMAEGGKTMGMMAGAMEKWGKAYGAARKGNLFEAASHLGVATSKRRQRRYNRTAREDQEKAVASAWLELQYGWKPLLQTVYDGARLIADAQAPIYRNVAYGIAKERFSEDLPTSYTQDFGTTKVTQVDRRQGVYEHRIKCVFTMPNSSAHRAAMSGLTNPAVVAWELVPYSFVVDWFLPIGDFLSLIDATNGLAFHSGCVTVHSEGAVYREFKLDKVRQKRVSIQGYKDFLVSRGKMNSFPSPALPQFKNPATVGHLANAMALITNLRK